MHEVSLALCDSSCPSPPKSFTDAKLVLPPKKQPEKISECLRVIKDEDQRPLAVHECGFRVACGSYVDTIRECAKKMVSGVQSGFLDATMSNTYGADQSLHDFGEGRKRGGGFSSDMIRAFPSLHHQYIEVFFGSVDAPTWISTLFFRILAGVMHCVCFKGNIRRGAESHRGLLQGNPLAAYFFIIFF